MSMDTEIIEKQVNKHKPEIKKGIYKIFEDTLTTVNVNIPELHDDKEAALAIYETMKRALDLLKQDIDEGKYDHY